ncbi:alanine/glycine:cation symporter family protein [Corynebacterium mendelii]|uniref:Alanine:cation symporter family protein n=1 Tax=Corynebacterium mendelii TaxID=2765362 RepID=A0A939DXP8_9CORY|nr:alanine/glycine:cation symporter family protein [Corynebacterium mendelii]MBN9643149.1 alanine:cation symporter family protein [Corynebacterium mendelii]
MEAVTKFVGAVSGYEWLVIPFALTLAGLYFCWSTILVQLRYIPEMFKAIVEKPSQMEDGRDNISAFKAFTISAASRVGTGNVAGVAIAIATGGPGAVFWMWTLAIIGGATSFVESTLAQVYKVRDKDSYVGGPAYYITRGLGQQFRWLAVIFVVAITFTYGFVFNAVQSNSIADAMTTSFSGANPMTVKIIVGVVLAAFTGAIIFGGVQRIGAVTQVLVPLMAVAYIVLGLIVCLINIAEIPGMIASIWAHAFGLRSFGGAVIGHVIMTGIKRGLFSNEAGMGSVPNAAATASVSHPAKQGLIQTLGVYFDTIIVCSVTAFIILLANPDLQPSDQGVSLTQESLAASVGGWGVDFLSIVILFLAFSSVIGNYYYGESNIEFLTRSKTVMNSFRALVVICVFLGTLGTVPLVWALADVFSGLMVFVNLCAIIPLGGVAVALLKHFAKQKAEGLDPIFHRDDLPNLRGWQNMECWTGDDPITDRPEQYGLISYRRVK